MRTRRERWRDLRADYVRSLRARGVNLTLRDRIWAMTEDRRWVALPATTSTQNPDHWWLAFSRDEFHKRDALGAILLCASSDGPLLEFALPGEVLRELEPDLPLGNQRPLLSFNIHRKGRRFERQLRGGRAFDLTERRGDVSWLRRPPVGMTDALRVAENTPAFHSEPAEQCFFASLVDGALRPLDPIDLGAEGTYLVRARKVDGAPSNSALRRLVARGGIPDLPPDFAEQHDHYAHGAPKR